MLVRISFANNNDRGDQTTRATALHIGDHVRLDGEKLFCYHDFRTSKLKIARISTPGRRFISWYGNMAWNSCEIEIIEVVKLVNYLRRRADWHIEEGPDAFCKKWDTGEVFVEADLMECVR